MTILQAIILGAVQGLTEFLPVSSSGHLVLTEHLLNVPVNTDVTFEVFVHFGTLLSVVLALWTDIREIVQSTIHALGGIRQAPRQYKENEHFRLAILIILGSIPAAYIGIRFEEQITEVFTDPKLVAVMLVVTGLMLFLTRLAPAPNGKPVGLFSGLLIGCAQAMAIIPGISRSGSTISVGMYLGISPVKSARFSFLLSIPVIAGATLLKVIGIVRTGIEWDGMAAILAGTAVAFASGYLAIRFLLRVIEKGRFSIFSIYCLIVGTLGIIFLD
ncbi:MAG: undecaprenyl-diphosphate phosphatase [Ignavibacterium sp.]|jgi:undecaprenyl-diphosphatase